jgi:hypothetical protein
VDNLDRTAEVHPPTTARPPFKGRLRTAEQNAANAGTPRFGAALPGVELPELHSELVLARIAVTHKFMGSPLKARPLLLANALIA